jgi:RNA recognition motif-containing protein
MTEETKGATLRLRGLPFSAEEAEIREFFGDEFELTSVHICKKNSTILGIVAFVFMKILP